jgi:hypothetical protein
MAVVRCGTLSAKSRSNPDLSPLHFCTLTEHQPAA